MFLLNAQYRMYCWNSKNFEISIGQIYSNFLTLLKNTTGAVKTRFELKLIRKNNSRLNNYFSAEIIMCKKLTIINKYYWFLTIFRNYLIWKGFFVDFHFKIEKSFVNYNRKWFVKTGNDYIIFSLYA